MMKKTILFALLLVAAGVARAQNQSLKFNQPFSTKGAGIQIGTVLPVIEHKPGELTQLQKQKLAQLLAAKPANAQPVYNEVFYSTMPVAGQSSRDTNMPVIKTGDARTNYTMLVKRIDIINPTQNKPAGVTP